MPSYGFSFRASTRKEGGAGRLYLRVVHGCKSRSITTGYQILPEEWDAERHRLLIPYGRSARALQLLEMERSMYNDLRCMDAVICELDRESGGYTVDGIMDRYRSVMNAGTLMAFTERLASLVEREGCYRTAKAYRTVVDRLHLFNGGKDIEPEHFTAAFICEFQKSLKSDGCGMNTVSFYMRTLRAIYNKAIAEGRIQRRSENPFAGVYTGVPVTRKRALGHKELSVLTAFDPAAPDRANHRELPERLKQALAMFLFCYHARGMCFVDMSHLKKADLRGDTIRYRRSKTGRSIELKVLPAMRRIIDWFAPYTAGSRYLFPVIDENAGDLRLQYESGLRLQNLRLKKVAAFCGITGCLSTHVARHSWATMARNAGLPLAVISEGLGHTSQRTTQIYLASLERSIIDHASRMVSEVIIAGWRSKKSGRHHGSGLGYDSGGLSAWGVSGGFGYSAFR